MPHADRHLLPDEFDQLLDDEEGFGVALLREHLRACPGCRAELAAQRTVLDALEALPAMGPAPFFTERVMARVDIFVPWHVTLRDQLARIVPRSALGRTTVATIAGVLATVVSLATVWVARRTDAAFFVADLARDRLLALAGQWLREALALAVGDDAAGMLAHRGAWGAALLAGAVVVTAAAVRAIGTARARRG